jgi:hypothetical protein
MTAPTTGKIAQSLHATTPGTTIPFAAIDSPGCYICKWSGHLLRVADTGIAPGRLPHVHLIGPDALFVTKISDNPYLTIGDARRLAANFDLQVNF